MENKLKTENGKFLIDGKEYSSEQICQAVRFWREYHLNAGDTECPICGTMLWERGLFVCEQCGRLLSVDEESPYENYVCKDCDPIYKDQKAYEEAVNAKIDAACGK